MPYVLQDRRDELDPLVEGMAYHDIKANGDLSYLNFAYFVRHILPNQSYNVIKNYWAELSLCADEIKRRYLDPYEDEKIRTNGDVL